MQNDMIIEFKQTTIENLELYSGLLDKDVNTMLEEALELYFDAQQKMLMEKNIEKDNLQTNLDYDEFWDGVDL